MLESGNWKSYEELEENLTLDEIEHLYMAIQERHSRNMKFAAALKGIDLPDQRGEEQSPLERAQNKAQAKMRGMTEEQIAFEKMGVKLNIIKEE